MKYRVFFLCLIIGLVSCKQDFPETELEASDYHIEDGLELRLVAAEPLIEAPVDISFDDEGRLWVLEMRGYMRSLSGANEEDPVGRIVIMEDRDNDGKADHYKVFLDSLKLARAFSHVYGGLLYVEPPNLWFAEIREDLSPGSIELVDSAYAVGGNVEHQPNGLLINIDNWIYSAKGTKRYRRIEGKWITESTVFRGQWGITRDPSGRLFYNDNSNQLRGDFVVPGVLGTETGYRPSLLSGQNIVNDQRVYPLQATPINRGYLDGVLDEEGKLRNVTSACGPLYFQGSGLDEIYDGDVFVCVPEANIVKRNIITSKGIPVSGEQAYPDREFLVSKDLGFRPVNLKNGPDGALYVVDMHRGIIQHKTYMTSYLREQLIESGLDSLTGMGRVIRVGNGRSINPGAMVHISPTDLIDSLESKNIWIRDRAQQLIIQHGSPDLLEPLRDELNQPGQSPGRIHALYCLEGLDLLRNVVPTNFRDYPSLVAHLLIMAAEGEIRLEDIGQVAPDSVLDLYKAYYFVKTNDIEPLNELLRDQNGNPYLDEIVLSNYSGDPTLLERVDLVEALSKLAASKAESQAPGVEYRGLTPGRNLYVRNCAVCHGEDGQGLAGLAPPLLNSEYVSGNPERLASILLYGLSGPVTVDGELYEFNNPMPGLAINDEMSDEDIRYIMNYIRNAFVTADIIPPGDLVGQVRGDGRNPNEVYTVDELQSIYEN